MIFFILAGTVAYDRYLTEKGEVGPIGHLIDFAGLARYKEEPRVRVKVISESFRLEMRSNLLRLSEKHRALQEKRNQLIRNREAVLGKMEHINGNLEKEAMEYANILNAEKKKFEKQFPEIMQLGQSLMKNYKEMDLDLRKEKYHQIRRELETLFDQMPKEGAIQVIAEDLSGIEKIINEEENVCEQYGSLADIKLQMGDDIIEQGLLACFGKKLEGIKSEFMEIASEVIQPPLLDTDEIINHMQSLRRELSILQENSTISEQYFQKGSEAMDETFKELVETLVEITEDDLADLMDIYEELWREQDLLFDNLEINRQRLYESHSRSKNRIKQLIKDLLVYDFSKLRNAYKDFIAEYKKLFEGFETNEKKLYQVSRNHWDENRIFIGELSEKAGFDLAKLMERRQDAILQHKRQKARRKDIESNLKLRRSMAETGIAGHIDNKTKQDKYRNLQESREQTSGMLRRTRQDSSIIQKRASEQMRRLREKVQRQGF